MSNKHGLEALVAYTQDSTNAAVEAAPAPETTTTPEEPEQKKPTKRKKSDGKRVNFVLPWEIYAQWEEVAEAFGGNFSQFAVKAIEKDLKNNAAVYKEVIERLS